MRHLRSDQTGIAAMEFALISPVVLLLLFGFLEFAWVQSARSALESSTMKAARQIAASDCPAERETLMIQTITRSMNHIKSSDGQPVKIETKAYKSAFGDVGEPEPFADKDTDDSTTSAGEGNGKYDLGEIYTEVNGPGPDGITKWDADMGKSGSVGGAGQIVSYTATYRVKSMVPFIASRFGNSETLDYPIRATTVIRNEPVFRNTGCT